MDAQLIDVTCDPKLKSWIETANHPSSDFSIQNLPFGIFSTENNGRRVGVAIGTYIVDLHALEKAGLLILDGQEGVASVFDQETLNAFVALGQASWRRVRYQLSILLRSDSAQLRDNKDLRSSVLVEQATAVLHLPFEFKGYSDFYSSRQHAQNVGSLFRDPENAILANWFEMPVGYNGRASSIVLSGTPVRRPNGQQKLPEQERPIYCACRRLDIELEIGYIIGRNSHLGEPVACAEAEDYIFGVVLLNDWSARDIQLWETLPLGPFNAKTFCTSISPWVVTIDALRPFRVTQPSQSPEPLNYLKPCGNQGVDIELEVQMRSEQGDPTTLCQTNYRHMYWTMAQQLAHHTASGCNLRVGDLMGSGTVSGPEEGAYGCLLEITRNGQFPIKLPNGEPRTYLCDGDEVVLSGHCVGDGYRVGFGTCIGKIFPAFAVA